MEKIFALGDLNFKIQYIAYHIFIGLPIGTKDRNPD